MMRFLLDEHTNPHSHLGSSLWICNVIGSQDINDPYRKFRMKKKGNTMKHLIFALSLVAVTLVVSQAEPKSADRPNPRQDGYADAIHKTSRMVSDPKVRALAGKHGLNVLNVTWEDTGRFNNSAVGPNISDMTIQVAHGDPKAGKLEVTCMPVIRKPNFSDKTCDLDPRDFTLLVGNHKKKGSKLKRISLYEFLENPTRYLNKPGSWKAKDKSLLRDRDGKVLVSAQACFLPVPKKGKATFNPVLFNYQSYKGDPAVLTVLVTREGTSVTVIDNTRDAFDSGSVWGQRLFHNAAGERASLTGERQSEFLKANPDAGKGVKIDGKHSKGKAETGLNMVLLIQIPLKQKEPMPRVLGFAESDSLFFKSAKEQAAPESNVENAVIGHGKIEGPFTEIDDLEIERDSRFPVRVTVQFYKATSNGVVSAEDMRQISEQIERVYAKSDYVGSLVTGGTTGRVTEYDGTKVQPDGWWERFWQRHHKNTGDSSAETIAKLIKLLGKNYRKQPVCDLYLRDLLAE